MSNGNLFHQAFMTAIRNKIPHRATLANTITDLLCIDKDAVYRRLRGQMGFSFNEMAIIARNMGISLDVIAGIENAQSKPTKINFSRQVNPTEVDYEMFEGHVNLLKSIKDEPDTKIIDAGNMTPHYLYQNFENLTRYHLFRWNYSNGFGDALPFHDIIIPERLRVLQEETSIYSRHVKSTQFVMECLIFQRIVTNIQIFAKIRLINEEDVSLLKKDLMDLINYLEKLAVNGKYEETGNEVSIFVSDIHFDTNYSCLKCKNMQLTLFRVFILNAIVSMDEEVFDKTCAWINSLKRMSTLISVSGERLRTMFFDEQRRLIDTL